MTANTPLPEVLFGLTVTGATGAWAVVRAHVTEGLSELYECAIEAACDDDVDPTTLLGKRAVLTLTRDADERRVCGIVVAAVDGGWVSRRRVAELTIAPELWLLGQNTNYRIFQEIHALEIVDQVLKVDTGYTAARLVVNVNDPPPVREYCTQYGESDLAFVRRLLEEEGLTFHFDHKGDEEALVITQGAQADVFPALATGGAVPVVGQGGATDARETIRTLSKGREVAPTGARLRDYDFTHPAAVIDEKRDEADALGARVGFEYPGRVTLGALSGKVYGESDARKLAPVRQAAARARDTFWLGRGNVVTLQPGRVIEVTLEDSDAPVKLLVVRVTHAGEAPEVLHLDASASDRSNAQLERYDNRFECVPAASVFRPARVTPKPRALTPQSAVVVPEPKTSTDPIATDAHGRIKVRFQWDRPGERTQKQLPKNASCWVRVQQVWAGSGWGFVFLPRVGMEVLVQFLDADPDRPVVTGCLYNGANAPPETLPDKKTRSVLRTQSVPDGGYNELAFEDEKGKELVYLRAQKDLTEKVFNDHLADYDHDETVNVGNDQTFTVKNNRMATVENDDTLAVTNNRSATIGGNDTLEVDKNLAITVFGASTLTVSTTHVMSIDEGLTVKVGGNSGTKLEMTPSMIRLSYQSCKLEMTAGGVKVEAGATKLELKTDGDATIDTPTKTTVTATGDIALNATADLKGSGLNVSLAAQVGATVKGNATAELSASGQTTVKGAIVMIN